MNDDRWKVLAEEVSFILRNSLRGSIGVKLYSFTKTIHAVCLEHFGTEDVQKEKTYEQPIEESEKRVELRVEQRLQKKRLKEMPNKREFVKQQFSEIKEKILVIARAENARKRRQKKRKARRNFEEKQKTFKFTKTLFEGEKNGVLKRT